jgi:uroporphyrinogen-III synthase
VGVSAPLEGWTVVVTRAEGPGGSLGSAFLAAGAEVLRVPTVEIGPPPDPTLLSRALKRLEDHDWLVFTSGRAVDVLAGRIDALPAAMRVAAVGPSTADHARKAGFSVTSVGDGSGAEALARKLVAEGIGEGTWVFVPTSSRGRPELEEVLAAAGAVVERVVAYETRTRSFEPAAVPGLRSADVVTFTSPSAVEGWHSAVGDDPARFLSPSVRYVAIGETTRTAAAGRGIEAVRAREASFEGMVDTVSEMMREP